MKTDRLTDVYSYDIIGSPPSEVLDDITQIASLLYEMPISLVTILDDKKQWFLSNVGLNAESTREEYAFCKHAFDNPNEVLVVKNPRLDKRFTNNPFVVGEPNIEFYAGAPLKTKAGNVMGTLCVIDTKPREFSENQKKALQILAKKAMIYIENYKTIYSQQKKILDNQQNLQKITNELPIGIYQLKTSNNKKAKITFVSQEIYSLYPEININELKERPFSYFKLLNPEDRNTLISNWKTANKTKGIWEGEFRTLDGTWHYTKAVPEEGENDSVIWYGYVKDISERMEYQKTLEQILFDISHVLRKPIANLVGLVKILDEEKLDQSQLKEFQMHIGSVSKELERFTEKLNRVYFQKHQELTG
ncbi:MAG: GAF domain-containing protein [Patiriisocius sp.]|uniref:GAF domain-containing protein n=1 Tax=Patiriisocius sp. TaxID=2822396 RepID=UPI003EF6E5BE